jgi:hypothetical protein
MKKTGIVCYCLTCSQQLVMKAFRWILGCCRACVEVCKGCVTRWVCESSQIARSRKHANKQVAVIEAPRPV